MIVQPAESDSAEPELNKEILGQVIQMGVPEQAAKHAVHQTGNISVDLALDWFF